MSSVIYETRGRAREYCELAVNLYRGCSHGCVYCYACDVLKISQEQFHQNTEPRGDILKRLLRDCQKMKQQIADRPILLCFVCDPYQPIEEKEQITRGALQMLKSYGYRVHILSKGGELCQRDFDLLGERDAFATSLTFTSDDLSKIWEPGAALPIQRYRNLIAAHKMGIPTWVSLEPVMAPPETLDIIEETHSFVGHYKVGKLNYHSHEKSIDWAVFARKAVEQLDRLGCTYYVKSDLARYLGKPPWAGFWKRGTR